MSISNLIGGDFSARNCNVQLSARDGELKSCPRSFPQVFHNRQRIRGVELWKTAEFSTEVYKSIHHDWRISRGVKN